MLFLPKYHIIPGAGAVYGLDLVPYRGEKDDGAVAQGCSVVCDGGTGNRLECPDNATTKH